MAETHESSGTSVTGEQADDRNGKDGSAADETSSDSLISVTQLPKHSVGVVGDAGIAAVEAAPDVANSAGGVAAAAVDAEAGPECTGGGEAPAAAPEDGSEGDGVVEEALAVTTDVAVDDMEALLPISSEGLRELEVFECQRWRALAGWSSKYLLPTDRHGWSSESGKAGWRSPEEAAEALVAPGWEARGSWTVAPNCAADSDGWSYGSNFQNTRSAKLEPLHFVRRRRHVLSVEFTGAGCGRYAAPPSKCSHCDAAVLEQVQAELVEALNAELRGPPTVARLVQRQRDLYKWLGLLDNMRPLGSPKAPLHQVLQDFIQSEKKRGGIFKSNITTVPNFLWDSVLTEFEMRTVSSWVVRRFMPEKACFEPAGHCCALQPVACPNSCGAVVSRYSLAAHDVVCQWKRVECAREGCGEVVARRDMDKHLASSCPLRPVKCPFASVGCMHTCEYRTVNNHLETCTQAHLLLSLDALQLQEQAFGQIREQQRQLAAQHQQLPDLVAMSTRLSNTADGLSKLQGQVAEGRDLAGRVAAQQTEQRKALAALDRLQADRDAAVKRESNLQAQVKHLSKTVASLEANATAMSARLQQLEAAMHSSAVQPSSSGGGRRR